MKRIIFFIIVLSSFISVFADDYRILFLNTKSISIGGKTLKKGDVFNDQQSIVWTNDKQAMKVQNLRSKKIRVITSKQVENKSSLYNYYVKTNLLSTRGNEEYNHLDDLLDEAIYVADSVKVKSWLNTDKDNYFFVKYSVDGAEKVVKFQGNDGFVLVSRDAFGLEDTDEKDIPVSLWYHFASGEEVCIEDAWMVRFTALKVV